MSKPIAAIIAIAFAASASADGNLFGGPGLFGNNQGQLFQPVQPTHIQPPNSGAGIVQPYRSTTQRIGAFDYTRGTAAGQPFDCTTQYIGAQSYTNCR